SQARASVRDVRLAECQGKSKMFEIVTETLLLRDFRKSDLDAFRSIRRDAKFQRFYDEEDSADRKADQLLSLFIEQAAETPRSKYQLAITTTQGELIGTCGIRSDGTSEFSIGCELERLWHGKGVALEAGKAMINFGFSELGASRIYAETVSENTAAIRLCRLLGMKLETERENDRYFKGREWGTTILSICRGSWSA
uniref:GNAT family N-acetyltransferase n=1 Tax=Marinimicrobium alkaliphilum TaxID=2202654 RepID=UPI001E48E844